MKFKTFKGFLKIAEKIIKAESAFDKNLEEVLSVNNGDVQIVTNIYGNDIIENILENIAADICPKNADNAKEWIDWLFYENILGGADLSFGYDGKEYEGTMKNVFKFLKKNFMKS